MLSGRLLLCGLLAALALPVSAAEVRSVAVDIGHSLQASGARSASGQTEFSFNRRAGLLLAQQLRERGLEVSVIGAEGNITQLSERSRLAQGRQLLLSVHHDSVQPQYLPEARRFHGYSLFVSRKNPFAELSLACARQIALSLQEAGERPTLHHAEPIAGENRPLADAALGIYWFDDLVVLKTATQPAVLIEHGVIVNAAEEERLSQPAVTAGLARAIAAGAARCQAAVRQ
ncbi:N-acetylmuramoyl-L-alanine amidase [Aquitalea magnusonii]|uniref:N-acetylmuramoyl-L-alanine amidase n=1 Tax=Aquitalea magnusonii TaxID=332411 RepID=A0A3G9GA16_9NEIS|nr:N-acetylmuramoyl-L-alanine amidase [Aquitalea magnusonii]BBF84758.1 N-acetylmuramoyl-L-alanine amidase [Aquitalea magnusonii]